MTLIKLIPWNRSRKCNVTLVGLELGWNRQVGRSRMGSTRRHVRPDVATTHQPRQATSIRTRRLPSVVVAARAERARFSHGYTASPWKFLRFHILVLHKNPSRRERITASSARHCPGVASSHLIIGVESRPMKISVEDRTSKNRAYFCAFCDIQNDTKITYT